MKTSTMIWRNIAAMFICFLALWPWPSPATTVEPPDFATLVKQAETIFVGDVQSVTSEWVQRGSDRIIISSVTFQVIRTIKGQPANPYVLKLHGGTVGDTTMEVDGVPKFAVGSRSLLFVENNGTQFCPLVGIMHGFYRVAKDGTSGKETMVKHDGRPLQNGAEIDEIRQRWLGLKQGGQPKAPASSGISREDFETEIKNQMRNPR